MRIRSTRTPAAALLALALCAPAHGACPAAWCDNFERDAGQWRLDGGGVLRSQADAASTNSVLFLPPGALALPAGPTRDKLAAGEHFVEARLRPAATGGDAARRALLLVRYADPRNWVGAAINIVPGRPRMGVDLVQMRDASLTRLRQLGHDATPAGGFQTLRVELARGELAAWLDGERVAATLPAAAPAAGAALLAEHGAFEFDDVRMGPGGAR
ncbi:MAG: hypothetical protein ACREWI_12960, partial [Telluria sp.]